MQAKAVTWPHYEKEQQMHKTTLIAALTAASLCLGSVAQAQGRSGGDDEWKRQNQQHDQRGDQRNDPRQDQRMDRPMPGKDHGRPMQNERPHDRPMAMQERGAGPDHNFRKGGRLPREYRNNTYVVNDWRGHHLSAPPRGYHWVQTGGDYVLIAITTGIIAQILLGN
jgi:Ni/Co efflux regulator RcnB